MVIVGDKGCLLKVCFYKVSFSSATPFISTNIKYAIIVEQNISNLKIEKKTFLIKVDFLFNFNSRVTGILCILLTNKCHET